MLLELIYWVHFELLKFSLSSNQDYYFSLQHDYFHLKNFLKLWKHGFECGFIFIELENEMGTTILKLKTSTMDPIEASLYYFKRLVFWFEGVTHWNNLYWMLEFLLNDESNQTFLDSCLLLYLNLEFILKPVFKSLFD